MVIAGKVRRMEYKGDQKADWDKKSQEEKDQILAFRDEWEKMCEDHNKLMEELENK